MERFFTITSYDLSASLENEDTIELEAESKISDGKEIITGGMIVSKTVKTTKNNKTMAFITLEDMFGTMEVIVFPNILSKYGSVMSEESIILVKGKITMREGEQAKIICDEAYYLEDYSTNSLPEAKKKEVNTLNTKGFSISHNGIYLRLMSDRDRDFTLSLDALLRYFSGTVPVFLIDAAGKNVKVRGGNYSVMNCLELVSELNLKLGEENVLIKI
jgi:DNA polymerase-3 subunit alpha